jgi:hypothetical protein
MSEDKKLIVLKTKQKEDSSVEDMVDDCVQLLADKKFSHGVTILFDEQTSKPYEKLKGFDRYVGGS